MTNKDMVLPYPLKTAVLFLVFNRPDTTKKVFEAIRQAKPPRLFIAGDGARKNKEDEREKVKTVRDYIMNHIDWNCEVKTLFRDKNLGCKIAVSSAINWFFENEEMGIVLEDDCLPSPSFFLFCQVLLNEYKDDTRIMHIGAYKHPGVDDHSEYSYHFTRTAHVWGWATWRRAWIKYDASLLTYNSIKNDFEHLDFFCTKKENKVMKKNLERVIDNKIDTWDYQWNFSVRINNALAIRSNINLIQNLGFQADATHTKNSDYRISCNIAKNISFPLNHPKLFLVSTKIEKIYYRNYISRINFFRAAKKILRNRSMITRQFPSLDGRG